MRPERQTTFPKNSVPRPPAARWVGRILAAAVVMLGVAAVVRHMPPPERRDDPPPTARTDRTASARITQPEEYPVQTSLPTKSVAALSPKSLPPRVAGPPAPPVTRPLGEQAKEVLLDCLGKASGRGDASAVEGLLLRFARTQIDSAQVERMLLERGELEGEGYENFREARARFDEAAAQQGGAS